MTAPCPHGVEWCVGSLRRSMMVCGFCWPLHLALAAVLACANVWLIAAAGRCFAIKTYSAPGPTRVGVDLSWRAK